MKINAKQIGFSKPFNVKPSLKIWMKTNQMTIKSLKLNALEVKSDSIAPTDPNYADTMLEIVEAEQKIAEEAVQYLAEVFKLNEKQIDHMEESITNARQLSNYVTYVAQRVQGMSDEQIRLANKKQAEKQKSEDPKKVVGDILQEIDNIKNQNEDINYLKKRMLQESGVLPSQLDNEDFMELLEVQKARSREDRPMNPTAAFAKLRG